MGDIFGGVMAILSGGATGLLGVVFQRLFDHWKLKQELDQLRERNAHEVNMRKVDADIMAQEWAARTKVAEVEATGKEAVADAQAFAASFQLEPQRYSEGVKPGKIGKFLLVAVDVLRGIVRPGLTVYLAWIATELYNDSHMIVEKVAPLMQASLLQDVYKQIVFTLLYLFTTCVLWWFGTRNKGKQPQLG
jgi:hypothetical protein